MPRPARRLVAAAALVVGAALLAACMTTNQQRDLDLINQTRRAHGVAGVRASSAAMTKAQRWSDHMARTGVLEHSGGGSRLDTSGVSGWCSYAENVAEAGSLAAAHDALVRSAPHLTNMVGRYDLAGTGVTRHDGKVWVAEIYLRTC